MTPSTIWASLTWLRTFQVRSFSPHMRTVIRCMRCGAAVSRLLRLPAHLLSSSSKQIIWIYAGLQPATRAFQPHPRRCQVQACKTPSRTRPPQQRRSPLTPAPYLLQQWQATSRPRSARQARCSKQARPSPQERLHRPCPRLPTSRTAQLWRERHQLPCQRRQPQARQAGRAEQQAQGAGAEAGTRVPLGTLPPPVQAPQGFFCAAFEALFPLELPPARQDAAAGRTADGVPLSSLPKPVHSLDDPEVCDLSSSVKSGSVRPCPARADRESSRLQPVRRTPPFIALPEARSQHSGTMP